MPDQAGRDSFGTIAKRLGPLAWLGAAATVLPPIGSILLLANIERVSAWLRPYEVAGPLMYVGAIWLLAGLAILPTYASAVLGGWAFGAAIGLICAMAGFLGASTIAWFISRRASGDRVESLLRERPKWQVIARALFGQGPGRTLLIVSLVRLPPNSPFALTNIALSSLRVSLPIYLLGTLIGMLPRTAVVVYMAAHFQQAAVEEQADWRLFALGIVITIGVLAVLWYISKRALAHMTAAPDRPAN